MEKQRRGRFDFETNNGEKREKEKGREKEKKVGPFKRDL